MPLRRSHRLEELEASQYLDAPQMDAATVLRLQAGNGMGQEDSQMIIEGMAQQGAEPTYCMGDDTPLPVLSSRPRILYDYFKQRFAQVCFPTLTFWSGNPRKDLYYTRGQFSQRTKHVDNL